MEDYGAAISVGAEQCFFGDWVMTPIGNQLGLESCSTFAVGDHVSAKLAIDNPVFENGVRRKALALSKQELFDCPLRKTRGVLFRDAYPYIINNGLHLEVFCPYVALDNQECKCSTLMAVWSPKEGEKAYITPGNALPDRHAVLLTGYGVDEDGVEYYTAKGSWGVHRWLNGYIRIRRDLPYYIFMIIEEVYWRNLAKLVERYLVDLVG